MRTRWYAVGPTLGLVPLLGGCDALWGGFNRENSEHCASRANACQATESCNEQSGRCEPLPAPTDVVAAQTSGPSSCTPSGTKQACWQAYTLTGIQSPLRSVWTDGPGDVWVVGDAGLVLHYDGTSWHRMVSGTQANLRSVWGTSANDVWAVGSGGVAIRWNGSAFLPDTGPNLNSGVQDFCCIWGSSANDIWAAGTHTNPEQYVLSRFDGGKWTRDAPTQKTPPLVPLALAGGRDGTVTSVLVVGATVLAKTDSTQYPATVTATPVATSPMGAWLTPGPVAFTVGMNGTIGRSTNAALSVYMPVVSPTTATLHSIWGAADGTLVAVGDGGTTIARDQTVWRSEPTAATATLNYVSGTDIRNVWAVGDGGTILNRTEN